MDRARSLATRWLAPDLGLVISVVAFFYCLFFYQGYQKLFRDSDSGWHIRTGEAILESRALPRGDPYSFSKAGQEWFAWEWASDALMGLAHRAGGLPGVALLYSTVIGACTWLWFRLHWSFGGNFFLACALASPMLSTANLHWLARPHLFGWLFLLGAVWYASAARTLWPIRWHQAAAVALFTALWANLHASFFLAAGVGLVWAFAHLVKPLVWDCDRSSEWRRAAWYLAAAVAAALGSLLTPYHWRLPVHVFRYLTNHELLARVAEFQSFDYHVQGAFQILLAMGIAGLGAVLALGQAKPAQSLFSLLLIALALRSARGLPLVGLLALPIANGAITEALAQARGLRPALARAIEAFLAYSVRVRRLDAGMGGWLWAPAAAGLGWLALQAPHLAAETGFPQKEFPVEAAAAVERLPASARILAPDNYGGYLIYRFRGQRKVYFDGRSDFYGVDFMKRYIRLVEVRPGWRQVVDDLAFTHALLPVDYSLAEALERDGWKRVHADSTALLLARPRTGGPSQ